MPTPDQDATRTHALRIRTAGSPGRAALANRFAEMAHALPTYGFTGAPELWVEDVPLPAGAPLARRRRRREMTRPLLPHRAPPVRAVLLEYADGQADLVLVAPRAVLDGAGLPAFACELLSPGGSWSPPGEACPAEPGDPAELADAGFTARPDWGFGGVADEPAGHLLLPLPDDAAPGEPATWIAALGVLLGRYDGHRRPAVAALLPGTAGTSVVPVDLDPATTFAGVVEQVRERLEKPLWRTDEPALGLPAADPGRRTGVGLIADLLPGVPPEPLGSAEHLPCLSPLFPLTVAVGRHENGAPSLRCDYRTDLFGADAAERFTRHLLRVHALLAEAPHTPLPELDLLTAAKQDRVFALGRPAAPLPARPQRIHDVFAAQAADRPDAIAVCCETDRLSYGELDRRANRMAHALRALGAGDGARVGVCLERSADLPVALLAVLKAGAAYVPMDPAYPEERLAYTTEDAALHTVITTLGDFPAPAGVRLIDPAELAERGPEADLGAPEPATGPDDPAYVIYTSGSTGRPKGVVVPHRNVVHLIEATADETVGFGLGPSDVWSLFHSSAFDFSVWEMWGCLLTGGRLVVVPYWVSRTMPEFHQLLVSEGVTVLNQTPSAFGQLVEADRMAPAELAVRLVVFGGEALDARTLLPWFDRYPETRCRVVNMYGITETTVHVTHHTLSRADALAGSRSVGVPLPGWWLRVLDPEGRPVPVGVAGEIHVGGAGVALNYLNKPDLTAQRFRTDPLTGERMYRSGDKGRLRPDGGLEHLGRLDTQVKVRGFRIELNEIRAVLLGIPGVSTAAVVLGHDDPADPATARLDAYVVLDGGDTAAVRRRAAKTLPDFMVPATVTALERMPLTGNGKLDVQRLPPPAAARRTATAKSGADAATRADLDEYTTAMLKAWQEVFGGTVGVDDDFFDLGGNSLLAMRIGTAMRRNGFDPVALRELYLSPTISRLTAARRESR